MKVLGRFANLHDQKAVVVLVDGAGVMWKRCSSAKLCMTVTGKQSHVSEIKAADIKSEGRGLNSSVTQFLLYIIH